ncbi:hypothetical protein GUJ93_ZPchr0006g43189 [Zizania palustris]|uniref:Uncharacterized protein n=1 Tax=Zizania palustris TaxID=103762 RepID=A0A8J5SX39_ZIZPA|nr:hypothetical protein GUJ93_ZPchr0006g43189 [Zizania palustris]
MGYWWDRVVLPVRRVWLGVAARFGFARQVIIKAVWAVEAEAGGKHVRVRGRARDVEMLSRTATAAPAPAPRRHSRFRQSQPWPGRFNLCAGF